MSEVVKPIINAMTVDVEDYFQVSAFEKHISRNDWSNHSSRVEENTDRILTLFAAHNINILAKRKDGRKAKEVLQMLFDPNEKRDNMSKLDLEINLPSSLNINGMASYKTVFMFE